MPGVVAGYGTAPIASLNYTASDSLPQLLIPNLNVGQSDSLNGTWVTRGLRTGLANTVITELNTVATATAAPGPFVSTTGKNYFAFVNTTPAPTVTGSYGPFCSAGGESVSLVGTNFSSITDVLFNGIKAASFVVNSTTSITAVTPNGISAGYITVSANGVTGLSTSTYLVRNVGTFSPTVNPSNGLICTSKDKVNISLNDIGAESYTWTPALGLDVAEGLNVIAQPTTSTTYTVSAVFSANGSLAACTVKASFIVGENVYR